MSHVFAYSESQVNNLVSPRRRELRYLRRAHAEKAGYNDGMRLRIKELRKEKGLTLATLAGRANMSVSYLSEIETGKKPLNSRRIEAIARGLGVSPVGLIDDKSLDAELFDHIQRLHRLSKDSREAVIRHAEALDTKGEPS